MNSSSVKGRDKTYDGEVGVCEKCGKSHGGVGINACRAAHGLLPAMPDLPLDEMALEAAKGAYDDGPFGRRFTPLPNCHDERFRAAISTYLTEAGFEVESIEAGEVIKAVAFGGRFAASRVVGPWLPVNKQEGE